jgi:RimJ/RimL family protein N-acetyltransferase
MNTYKILNKQVFSSGRYSLVPIRFEDRYDIMQWRNEQIYHLRQVKSLTKEAQDAYFDNVVAKLFDQEMPSLILFSFLEGAVCVGYGGLVHINWIDKNAEVSFIINTELEQECFSMFWTIFLQLIEELAFNELNLHKLHTFCFDLRPNLYGIIEKAGFIKEGRLKETCLFNGEYKDILLHGKINKKS